jgi:hypothetical protein
MGSRGEMKHQELVKYAGLWLQNAKGCNPVFIEKGFSGCAEIPDAIGWTAHECILVECKTSKEDLIANSKKVLAIGNLKYFLMTEELFQECRDKIPEGWGVITVNSNLMYRQERFKNSTVFESDLKSEVRYLRSRILEVQRYGKI